MAAGLLTLGLLAGVLAAGKLLAPAVWFAAFYPGMLFAEALISLLPEAANAWLAGGGDEGPAAFAGLSLVLAFLFWWACALAAVRLRHVFTAKQSPP